MCEILLGKGCYVATIKNRVKLALDKLCSIIESWPYNNLCIKCDDNLSFYNDNMRLNIPCILFNIPNYDIVEYSYSEHTSIPYRWMSAYYNYLFHNRK